MLKKIRVGRSEIIFFLILFFRTELMLDGISTFQEWYLTGFCQNKYPLDIKIYIGRQK